MGISVQVSGDQRLEDIRRAVEETEKFVVNGPCRGIVSGAALAPDLR